jgi:hypothetical protein
MNYPEKIEIIKNKFQQNGFNKDADEIKNCQEVLGTPGEVFACISFFLNTIRKNNTEAYQIAKEEIDAIIEYAKSINYIQ